ncbi:MAG: SH3 domain-containing protein [Pseudomonadota bacterium]
MKHIKHGVLVAACSLVLTGCAVTPEMQAKWEENKGKIVGGAAGVAAAVLATEGASPEAKLAAILLGAYVGSLIGDQFARALNERDQAALYSAQQEAAYSNQAVSFTGSEEGVSGRVSVVEGSRSQQNQPVEVRYLKDKVDQVPPLDLVGAPYRVKGSGVNVRGGPGTDYKKVDLLASGETVQVIGKVKGKNWYLISRALDGTAGGFVSSGLLALSAEPMHYVEVADAEVAKLSVDASSTCKTVRQEVTTADGPIAEDIRVCQQGNGQWKAV